VLVFISKSHWLPQSAPESISVTDWDGAGSFSENRITAGDDRCSRQMERCSAIF